MKRLSKKTFIFFLLVFLLIFVSITIYYFKIGRATKENISITAELGKNTESIMVDFDGDGDKETVKIVETAKNRIAMDVYNVKGEKIASYVDDINLYPTSLYKIINLNTNSKKQYLQWNMATGPHQVETVFLTIMDDKVQPIYSFDFEKKTMYAPFYTSRGELVVEDADYDGLKEVIENVDEYPVGAPRLNDPEIEKMIREEFSKSGFSEGAIQANIDIVSRENYGKGRGKKVILAVHSFVDSDPPFFRRLPKVEYDKVVDPLVAASLDISKKSEDSSASWETNSFLKYDDLDQDSKDFNSFVRLFWTGGRPFEKTITENADNVSL